MDASTAATWTVDYQVPVTRATKTGSVEEGYDVTFTTGEGHTGKVFVPHSKYTPAKVQEAIQAQANMMDAVGALTNDTGV